MTIFSADPSHPSDPTTPPFSYLGVVTPNHQDWRLWDRSLCASFYFSVSTYLPLGPIGTMHFFLCVQDTFSVSVLCSDLCLRRCLGLCFNFLLFLSFFLTILSAHLSFSNPFSKKVWTLNLSKIDKHEILWEFFQKGLSLCNILLKFLNFHIILYNIN